MDLIVVLGPEQITTGVRCGVSNKMVENGLNAGCSECRTEMKEDMAEKLTELKGDMAEKMTGMKGDKAKKMNVQNKEVKLKIEELNVSKEELAEIIKEYFETFEDKLSIDINKIRGYVATKRED